MLRINHSAIVTSTALRNMKVFCRVSLFILLLIIGQWSMVNGQIRMDDDGSIENTEIVVEKNKKITLPEIKRPFDKINTQRKTNVPEPQKYDYKELPAKIPDIEPKIRIATIKDELATSNRDNYVRGGFGNYTTTYFEGRLFTKTNEKYLLGLYGKHLASGSGPLNNSGNSFNTIGLNGRYFLKKAIVSADAAYSNTGVYYYGNTNQSLNIDKETIRQAYNQFTIGAELQKADTNMATNYQVKARYYSLIDHYYASESEFAADFKGSHQLNEKSRIHLQSSLSVSSRSDNDQISRNLFNIRPEYEYQLMDNFKIRGGLNFAVDNDTSKNLKSIHVYPVVHAEYGILNKLTGFAGLDGGMEKNMLRTFINQNPYLAQQITLHHTNKTYEVYAGLKGNITNYVVFKSALSYSAFKNMSFFVNDITDSTKFSVQYNSNTTGLFKFSNEIAYEQNQKFKIGLRAAYYSYSFDNSVTDSYATPAQAWHRPAFEGVIFGNYNLYNKLAFGLDIFYISGIKAKNYTSGKSYELADIVDINLTIKYKITDRLAAFLYFYNVLSKNYERYNYYQVKGINVVGGLTFTF